MNAAMRIFLLVFLCVVRNVLPQTEPKILSITSDQWVTQKDTVILSCKVQNSGYPLSWKRSINNSTVEQISTDTTLIIKNNRFAVNFDSPTSAYILTISEIEQSDIGTYICEISLGQNSTNLIKAETKLEFFEEASYYNSTETEVQVNEGSNFTIQCYANGKPKPTITIKRYDASSSAIISSRPGNLWEIDKITKQDEGNYTCEADTPALTVKRNVRVFVIAKPIFLYCTTKYDYYGPKFSAEFVCVIDSVPSIEIFWFRDGKDLTKGENLTVATDYSVSDKKLHRAKLNVSGEEKVGVYLITARNKVGDANRTFAFSNGTWSATANSPCGIPEDSACGSNFWIWFAICVVLIIEIILHREQLKLVFGNGKKWCEEQFHNFQGRQVVQQSAPGTGPDQGLRTTSFD
ncbi:lachesin-like [Planococcus citri]|uniref:lachesin-like n=1 Tax=Planococcus citri TaxID=170843 RepID=UPI0031F7C011